jgi:hypothetical protein
LLHRIRVTTSSSSGSPDWEPKGLTTPTAIPVTAFFCPPADQLLAADLLGIRKRRPRVVDHALPSHVGATIRDQLTMCKIPQKSLIHVQPSNQSPNALAVTTDELEHVRAPQAPHDDGLSFGPRRKAYFYSLRQSFLIDPLISLGKIRKRIQSRPRQCIRPNLGKEAFMPSYPPCAPSRPSRARHFAVSLLHCRYAPKGKWFLTRTV